jgi:ParB-like chromosome segregation protein Spo0J
MNIRNRVKSLRMVPASDLRPNPKNWRTHPKAQADALRGVLAEVGLADACLARELPDGSLMLIDGHLRAETLGDGDVPVLILDVNEAEADKLLATLDPLAAMADSDAAKLDELLRNVDTGSEALQELIASTATQAGLYETLHDSDEQEAEPESSTEEIDVGDFDLQHKCPKCGFEFNDKTP